MKRVIALGAMLALLLAPLVVRLLKAQSPSAPPPPPPTYTLTDLGRMDLSAAPSGPTALNSSGQVAGLYFNYTTQVNRAFLWSNGTLTELGTLGGAASFGYGINASGQIAGSSQLASTIRAFIWQNGVMTNLGDPSGDASLSSEAFAINTAGDVGGYENQAGGVHPIIWKGSTHAGATVLSSLPCQFTFCDARVLALNDAGQAAGFGLFGTGVQHPIFWSSTGQATDLGTLNAGSFVGANRANAISSNGLVAGYSQIDAYTVHAFSWQNGVIADLGAIPGANPYFTNLPPDNSSSAWGVNSKGQIVGISAYGAGAVTQGNGGRAFLYTNGTMYDLTSLVPGTNWKLLKAAWAINDAGQIVGVGIDPSNTDHGFLLTPIITPTTTTVSSSANPSVLGQQVSFTATVTPTQSSSLTPTGNVTFNDGSTVLGTVALSSGTAIFNTAGLNVGGHSITANYAGDNNFGSSTLSAVNQAVNQAVTSTALAASPNPANVGQSVTFTATVAVVAPGAGTPTGTVKFLDGGSSVGTGAVNSAGNATFSSSSLARGSHSITAVYGGDTNFVGSSSSTVNQVISQPATSTALAASPNPANLGQTVTFTATVNVVAPGVGAPTGTVTFLDGPTTLGIGVLSPGGTATLSTSSLAAGSHTVTASYGGDATFAGSTSTGVIVTVQGPPPPVQITDNETIHVADAESFPDVFDAEAVHVADTVFVTPLIQVSAPVAEFSAGTLGFGGQSGSQTITVSDIGTASLTLASATISGSSQFTITQIVCSNLATSFSTTLPSGGTCMLTVGYSASATPASDIGALVFTDNAALSNLASVPAGLSFTQSIPLSGARSTTGPPPPPPAIIPVMHNETIHVTDTPSFPDVFDAEAVRVTDAVTVTPLINVAAPVAEYSAGSLGFGNVAAGQTGTQALTVSDIGKAPLTISSAILSAGSAFNVAQVSCSNGATSLPTTLPVGGACNFLISYLAPMGTAANDTLMFTDNAALSNVVSVAAGSSYAQSIALSGSGSSTSPPPPPPAVIPIADNETIHVTDTPSFPDVLDAEQISVTDQVSIQVVSSTTTSISITGATVYGTSTSAIVSVGSSTATVTGSVSLSVDGGAATTLSLTSGSATFNLGVLKAGNHTLAANFPAQGNFLASSAQGTFAINQATPTITWANPAPIPYGTALSGTQLNAMTSAPGTLTYNPPAGTVLKPGSHMLSVTLSPSDSTDYTTATATVTITVLNTTVGTNVSVTPVDTTTGSTPVTLKFTNVTTAGVTSLTSGPNGAPPPPGFEVPAPVVYYDISTTAAFTGTAQVCFHYANLIFFGSTAPHVFHLEGGVWVDRTTTIDTVNLVVCGVVPSLSPFALFAPKPVLTITANNASRQFGAPDPSFSVSYSGFVGTDTPVVLSGTLSCSSTDTVTSPVGTYAINCSGLSSPNYVVRYAAGVLTVTPASTTTSVSVSPSPVKYSDYTALTATVSPTSAGGQTLTGNVQFSLNGGTLGSAVPINSSGVATLSQVQVNLSAGSYPVKAVFTSANANFAGSTGTTTQNVAQENAFILYSGDTIAQVGTSLNLRATVWDSAATGYPGVNPESGPTATIGDITKMWIAFDIYPAGSCGNGTPSTLYAQVALTGTAGIGVAMTALSSSSEVSYCVISRLVAGNTDGTKLFYTAPNAQGAGLDFYVNSGQFATGGGWVNDPTGSHGNFGFNARYNSTGSPKGQMVYVYRALYNGVLADFIIKSNALTALQFTGTTYPISSTLQGKANAQVNRASDGLSLFSVGNYTFSATVTDSGQNGTTGKQFSLIVYDASGVPYHSVPAGTSLQGGDVVVHLQ